MSNTEGGFDRNKMAEAIAAGTPLNIKFPVINENIREVLHFVLNEMLKKYNKFDIMETLYSSLKELIINGVKANMKHFFFKKSKIDPRSEEELLEGYRLLKEKLNERELDKFEKIARKNKLNIDVTIIHSSKRIIVLVENNSPMTEFEVKRIRDKFKRALSYDSIGDFYMDFADDIEGSGLGITMIVLMLKSQGIDPHAFTVDTKNHNSTIAKVEFPLEEDKKINRAKDK